MAIRLSKTQTKKVLAEWANAKFECTPPLKPRSVQFDSRWYKKKGELYREVVAVIIKAGKEICCLGNTGIRRAVASHRNVSINRVELHVLRCNTFSEEDMKPDSKTKLPTCPTKMTITHMEILPKQR
jgi:hypothetical protein